MPYTFAGKVRLMFAGPHTLEQKLEMKMRFCKHLWLAALLAAVLLLLPSMLLAQSVVTGALNGTVTDPSGAVIVGASVTLTSKATGAALTTETSSSGGYSFGLVKPGSYTLIVKQTGFKQSSESVDVALGETL